MFSVSFSLSLLCIFLDPTLVSKCFSPQLLHPTTHSGQGESILFEPTVPARWQRIGFFRQNIIPQHIFVPASRSLNASPCPHCPSCCSCSCSSPCRSYLHLETTLEVAAELEPVPSSDENLEENLEKVKNGLLTKVGATFKFCAHPIVV